MFRPGLDRDSAQLRGKGIQLAPILQEAGGGGIESLAAWQARRAVLRGWWLDFLKPPMAAGRSPSLTLVAEDRVEGVVRQLVRYEVEPGVSTEAYLLKPGQCDCPARGALVFHSTVDPSIRQPAGVEGEPAKAFGLNLARRGYVALCPRNFLWSETARYAPRREVRRLRQRHPQAKGMGKMLSDAIVALDILAGLPEVDGRRLCAVGHSLGAKEVLYLAALDERIRVAVSSEGGIGTKFSNWDAPWYLGKAVREKDFAHEHHELLALAAPRPFLLVGGDSADGERSRPFVEAALPVYKLYGGTARPALFNHKQGHSVPPAAEQRIYAWLDAHL
jgi:dienelactone hydrolase